MNTQPHITHEANEYDNSIEPTLEINEEPYSTTSCNGCLMLDEGVGGENQLAHMDPGGCMWYLMTDEIYNREPEHYIDINHINDLDQSNHSNYIDINPTFNIIVTIENYVGGVDTYEYSVDNDDTDIISNASDIDIISNSSDTKIE